MDLIGLLWADSIAPAIVTYALSISLAKMFAKRNRYKIDVTQVSGYRTCQRIHSGDPEPKTQLLCTFPGVLCLRSHERVRFLLPMHQRWTVHGEESRMRAVWREDTGATLPSLIQYQVHGCPSVSDLRPRRGHNRHYRHSCHCAIYGNAAFCKWL